MTSKERFKIRISDSVGDVTAEAIIPENPIAIMVLAHGAGANMDHRFMKALANGLTDEKIATVRFNFPYMEKEKKGRPDPPPIAEKTIDRVLEDVSKKWSSLPIIAAGKSFGGRMSSNLLSKKNSYGVKGIIFYGFPLHPAGKPSVDRADHLKEVTIPMLFLQGTRDALAELSLIRQVTQPLQRATLTLFEGADHSFAVGKKEIVAELIAASGRWIIDTVG